jgi:glycosyltransferase involved in cell wall biosynthesis
LWVLDQYSPRPLVIDPSYALTQPPPRSSVISIVTPTLNQAQFLRATIDSVLSQNYPNLRYHVQDGGSTDGTKELLTTYGARLSWSSEPDSGQANAINRAFAGADCDVLAYLNSDDVLLPGTLAYVARMFAEMPDVDLIYGNRIFIDSSGHETGRAVLPKHDDRALSWGGYVPQETLFWRHKVWATIGPFDETFDYALDWEFLLRARAAGLKFFHVPRFLACFRVHTGQKTQKNLDLGLREVQRLRNQYLGRKPSRSEIAFALLPYLSRQFVAHWMYKCGMSRF